MNVDVDLWWYLVRRSLLLLSSLFPYSVPVSLFCFCFCFCLSGIISFSSCSSTNFLTCLSQIITITNIIYKSNGKKQASDMTENNTQKQHAHGAEDENELCGWCVHSRSCFMFMFMFVFMFMFMLTLLPFSVPVPVTVPVPVRVRVRCVVLCRSVVRSLDLSYRSLQSCVVVVIG